MPKIEYAEGATEIAVTFLKNYHHILQRPLSARMDHGKWTVEVDVGAFFTTIAKVIIDAETGGILEFEVPPSPYPASPPGSPHR